MSSEINLTSSNHELKELFLDYNMNYFLNILDDLERYHELGIFNSSKSYNFIEIFMDNLYFSIDDENDDIESFSE